MTDAALSYSVAPVAVRARRFDEQADQTFALPSTRARIAYAICALPFVVGAAAGQTEVGIVVALSLAVLACVVAGSRWLLAVLFACLPFQQAIVPGDLNVAASDLVTVCLLLAIVPKLGRLRGVVASIPLAFYLFVTLVASAFNWDGMPAAVSWARMVTTTIVPLIVFATMVRQTRHFADCLAMYIFSTSILACFVLATFARGGINAAMYTLDLHKNAMGTTFAVAVVVIVALVMLRVSPVSLLVGAIALCLNGVGLLLTLSRGGWVAAAVGVLLLLVLTKRFRLAIGMAIPAAIALLIVWQFIPEDRKEYAVDVSLSAKTTQTRLDTIEFVLAQFRSSPVIGVGVGLRKYAEPHNMLVLNLGETGIVGTAALVAAVGIAYNAMLRGRSRAAVSRSGASRASAAVPLIAAAILTVTLAHGMFDVYWRRGVAAAGWAAVGAAISVRRSDPRLTLIVDRSGRLTASTRSSML